MEIPQRRYTLPAHSFYGLAWCEHNNHKHWRSVLDLNRGVFVETFHSIHNLVYGTHRAQHSPGAATHRDTSPDCFCVL